MKLTRQQAREEGILDELLALHGMTEDDIKPKRKKYKEDRYHRKPKTTSAGTQTKDRKTSKHRITDDGQKEAIVPSNLVVEEPPSAENVPVSIEYGVSKEAAVIEEPKASASMDSKVLNRGKMNDSSCLRLRSRCSLQTWGIMLSQDRRLLCPWV